MWNVLLLVGGVFFIHWVIKGNIVGGFVIWFEG